MKDKLDYAGFADLCRGAKLIELEEGERHGIRESRKAFEGVLKSNPGKSY